MVFIRTTIAWFLTPHEATTGHKRVVLKPQQATNVWFSGHIKATNAWFWL